MVQNIVHAVTAFFGNGWIATFLLSMIPLVELKGAIPVGSTEIGVIPAFVTAYFGSVIVCIPLYFLLRPVLELFKRVRWFRRLALRVEYLFVQKAEKIAVKGRDAGEKARAIMMWGVFAFVALPLPMTGVWTGTAVAVFLGLKFWDAFFPIALGNLTAGLLIALMAWLFRGYMDYVILGLAVCALVLLAVFAVRLARLRPPAEGEREGKKKDN